MSKRVQFVRHDSSGLATFLGLIGEVTVNTTNNSIVVHNGVTVGGFEQARADLTNVANATSSLAGKMTAAQVIELTTATADIATNVAAIATNAADIATNAAAISANASNISTNAANISTIEGRFTTGVLNLANGGTGAATAADARTNLGVDPAGTDNSTNVSLAGTLDYITITGQVITRGPIVLTTDVSGILPVANGGTGSSTASGARTNLGVDPAGTDNSTNVTLAGTPTYLTIAGQVIMRGLVNMASHVTGTLAIGNGGTGGTTAAAARSNLGLGSLAVQSTIDSSDLGTDVNSLVLIADSGIISGSPTNVDITGIPATFNDLVVMIDQIRPATNAVDLRMRVGTGAGPTWQTGNVYSSTVSGGTYISLMLTAPNGANDAVYGKLDFLGYSNTTFHTLVFGLMGEYDSDNPYGSIAPVLLGNSYAATTVVTALRFYWASGVFANVGRIRVYGRNV